VCGFICMHVWMDMYIWVIPPIIDLKFCLKNFDFFVAFQKKGSKPNLNNSIIYRIILNFLFRVIWSIVFFVIKFWSSGDFYLRKAEQNINDILNFAVSWKVSIALFILSCSEDVFNKKKKREQSIVRNKNIEIAVLITLTRCLEMEGHHFWEFICDTFILFVSNKNRNYFVYLQK